MPLATTAAPARKRMLPEGERVDVAALVVSPAGVSESAPVDVDESAPVDVDESESAPAPVLLAVDESLHATVLHVCSDGPTQGAPLPDGAGRSQRRACVPPPHVAEHTPNCDQPPSTVGRKLMLACQLLEVQSTATEPNGSSARHWKPVPVRTTVGVVVAALHASQLAVELPIFQIETVHVDVAVAEAHAIR